MNSAIDAEYADRSPEFVDSIMEMFEVLEVKNDHVVLAHHFEEIIFEPVWMPDEILKLLRTDDLFLMIMGKDDGQWLVLWMSPAYETWNWLEDGGNEGDFRLH